MRVQTVKFSYQNVLFVEVNSLSLTTVHHWIAYILKASDSNVDIEHIGSVVIRTTSFSWLMVIIRSRWSKLGIFEIGIWKLSSWNWLIISNIKNFKIENVLDIDSLEMMKLVFKTFMMKNIENFLSKFTMYVRGSPLNFVKILFSHLIL